MNFIIRIILSGLALLGLDYFMDSIVVESFGAAVLAVIILAIVNTFIRPIVGLFALPFTILTLGLFTFVINGAMFYLTSYFVSGFEVTSFVGAIIGAFFMSLVTTLTTQKN